MNGYKLKLPVAVTDNNIPILYPDPIMSTGSLMLVDGSLSTPADLLNGSIMNNIAVDIAAAMVGSGNISTLSPYIVRGAAFSSPVGIAEITSKKGIHTIISQVNHTNNTTQNWGLHIPSLVRAYLYTNRSHKFYFSAWRRTTRVPASGLDFAKEAILFRDTNNYLTHEHSSSNALFDGQFRPYGAAGKDGQRIATGMVLGNYIKNAAINTVTGDVVTGNGTASGADSEKGNALHAIGGNLNAFTTGSNNKHSSFITYRIYIEDMTVSGRTYAELDALDYALYQAAFASGGKFYGDTFTDPSTLP
jgi:hypothetical protein